MLHITRRTPHDEAAFPSALIPLPPLSTTAAITPHKLTSLYSAHTSPSSRAAQVIVALALKDAPPLPQPQPTVRTAEAIAAKHAPLWRMLGRIMSISKHAAVIPLDELAELEVPGPQFVSTFRSTFPAQHISLKFHLIKTYLITGAPNPTYDS